MTYMHRAFFQEFHTLIYDNAALSLDDIINLIVIKMKVAAHRCSPWHTQIGDSPFATINPPLKDRKLPTMQMGKLYFSNVIEFKYHMAFALQIKL